ncbi:hypothetical protein DMUE_0644 [Dictyocoela muelleri]|nr:hypothetical protein DMUE_0644 [Dictyocoela muelleri]
MLESIRDMFKKDRNKVVGYQPALAIDTPDFLKKERTNNDFLRYDSGITDESRFIIFIHTEKEKIFKNVKFISIDGTFKSVPRTFYQCVVIHGMLLSKSWAFCYVLMMTKTQIDYERVFRKIREISDIKPMFVGVDFERGLANAIEISFKAKLSYCFFSFRPIHFAKDTTNWVLRKLFTKQRV